MGKKKIYHNKLIRDNVPEVIESNNEPYETVELDDKKFETELKKKLVEESKEVSDCSSEELVNELADVLELIKSIAAHYNISFKKVEGFQKKKRKERGAFKKRLFLIWTNREKGKGDLL